MFRWLDRIADESHQSETQAVVWHLGFVALYAGALCFHIWAARRHWAAAQDLTPR